MGSSDLPAQFLRFNSLQSKNPVIVVQFAGVNDLFTNSQLLTQILYGDPGVIYGLADLVYGGLKPYLKLLPNGQFAAFRDLLELQNSNPTIQQRLEPEQGRASVSTLSLSFVDKDNFMTQLLTPGLIIPEILGVEVNVFLGYQQTSFPLDYFRLFRGYVSNVDDGAGLVTLQFSDPGLKLRTTLFYIAQTATVGSISPSDTLITCITNSNFFIPIDGPDGTMTGSIHTYIQIEDEWIEAVPIQQGNAGYSVFIQGVTYTAASGHTNDVSIEYVGGGTAGSEVVTVTEAAITVQIETGVSTASQVAFAVTNSPDTAVLVSAALFSPDSALAQTTQAPTYTALTTYASRVVEGMLYTAAPGHSTDISITYANDGTAGAETVTAVGPAITVHMQTGGSTNSGILAAFNAFSGVTASLASAEILPTHAGDLVSATGPVSLVSAQAGTQFAVIARGARGTTAAAHADASGVNAGVQVGDSTFRENAIDMALKLMLSGWNGPWIQGVVIQSIGPEPDASPFITTTDFIQMHPGVDAVRDYGVVTGDFIVLQGSGVSANNNKYLKIVRFEDFLGDVNRRIFIQPVDPTFQLTKETPTTATLGFRSQYDVYPVDCGLHMTPKDVDIAAHIFVKNTFLGTAGNDLIFFITSQESSGKDFLSSQIYLPIGAYALTKRGKLACNYHAPPIANQSIVIITKDNVVTPDKVKISRGLNSRSFYNEIDLTFDYDDSGNPRQNTAILDAPSYHDIGVLTPLPIDAKGVYAGYSSQLLEKRAFFLLQRYKRGAVMLKLDVNWELGCTCEAGDIALVRDSDGVLQIANFSTGDRGLGNQLFEIIDRTFNIKQGNVSLTLVGNVGAFVTDRFAVISPSSHVVAGSTTNKIIIEDSFGALFPGNESAKWVDYIGQEIRVHSFDYSVSADVTLQGIDPANNYALETSLIPFTPLAGYLVDIIDYPTTNDPTIDEFQKLVHCFLDTTVPVVSGIDQRNFTIGAGDLGSFFIGTPVRIHSPSFAQDSGDLTVVAISGTTITVSAPMGFTPSGTSLVDLCSFPDFDLTLSTGYPYRWI